MSLIFQYSFIVVALGTMCLAISTGIVGTISILKRQSLIGDAVGHASLLRDGRASCRERV